MNKTEYSFNIWMNKLIELHKFIHDCKYKNDIDNEEYYINKYFKLYDHLTNIFSTKKVNDKLNEIAKYKINKKI